MPLSIPQRRSHGFTSWPTMGSLKKRAQFLRRDDTHINPASALHPYHRVHRNGPPSHGPTLIVTRSPLQPKVGAKLEMPRGLECVWFPSKVTAALLRLMAVRSQRFRYLKLEYIKSVTYFFERVIVDARLCLLSFQQSNFEFGRGP